MATISNNEIKIKYSLDTTDLANATALFDRLSAEDRRLLNDLKRLQAQLNATGQAGQAAGNNIGNGLTNARNKTKGLFDDLVQMQNPLKQIGVLVATAFSIQSLYRFGRSVLDTTIKFESLRKAIQFTSGTMTQGIINFQFLEKLANDLGLPLEAAAQGFKSFSAAAQRAGITMEQQQVMFTDLSKAMAALQVTSADAQLIFFGFSQLMSKAKVSAQELYHQIGERLPLGMQAAQIAAGRMTGQTKVSTSELMKMVETGKLLSEKFAPEFTKALGELAGDAAKVETLGKSFTRLGDAWDKMLYSMGESNKGWFKETLDGFTGLFDKVGQYFKGFSTEIEFVQTGAFDNAIKKAEKMSNESIEFRLEILEKQKEVAQKEVEAIQKTFDELESRRNMISIDGKDFLGITPEGYKETKANLENAQLALAKLQGTVDAYVKTLKDRTPIVTEEEVDDGKKLENLYKKLIDQQEALMKAEEDLIKSRTKAGTNQDILILENRIKFNNKMLAIDQDARFKELELAKNNAVKRRAEITKDEELTEETIRQVRFKAFAAEKEYLDKSLEVIQDAQRKRRQAIQTDEQNELDTSIDFYKDKLKVLKESYEKNKALEGLQKNDLKKLEDDFKKAKLQLTEDSEKARLDIIAKYRAKEKAETQKTDLEIRSTMVEAASIRNQALTRVESEKADIAEEAAISQIKIEKEKNEVLRLQNEENSTLSIQEKENLNKQLEAQDVLLDAKLTEIVKQGEQRRLEERQEKAEMVMQIGQTLADGLFDIYNQQLNNELTALNNKYNEEVRLADGNKQKLAELEQQKEQKERELKIKQFRADQMAATARVIFATATQLMSSALNPAMIPYIIGLSVAQLAAIAAQPVPEFAEGTKGIPFKGGPAIVGEKGIERVVTESGKVYYTPPTATLVDLPKGSQVIPNHALSKKELFMATALSQGKSIGTDMAIVPKLDEIGGILKSLPVHQVNMNEKGFEKFIRTPRRTTKILNSQFPNKF